MDRVDLLCLLGRAGHGKTTVANYLRDRYGAEKVSLATALKRVAQKVMAFSDEQLYGSQELKEALDPRYGMSPRRFLQLLGTEGLREEFGTDVHVNNLLRLLAVQHKPEAVYVVDDVRFPDEVQALASRGARVLKLVCTDAPRAPEEHISESSIDLVPPETISASVISSRAEGLTHLFDAVESVLYHTESLRPLWWKLQNKAYVTGPHP